MDFTKKEYIADYVECIIALSGLKTVKSRKLQLKRDQEEKLRQKGKKRRIEKEKKKSEDEEFQKSGLNKELWELEKLVAAGEESRRKQTGKSGSETNGEVKESLKNQSQRDIKQQLTKKKILYSGCFLAVLMFIVAIAILNLTGPEGTIHIDEVKSLLLQPPAQTATGPSAGTGKIKKKEEIETTSGRLYINTSPGDAVIKVLNIGLDYERGMELDEGIYHIEISKWDYETVSDPVEVKAGLDNIFSFNLNPSNVKDAGEVVPMDTWKEPVTGMEFIWVPGDCYGMGSDTGDADEIPVHEVCFDGFWMSRYEVTLGQYRKFLQETDDASGVDWESEDCPLHKDSSYSLSGNRFGTDHKQPMVEVSWDGARAFIDWLSNKTGCDFRLPTEAEWEYVARSGGKEDKYSGGSHIDRVAWYVENSKSSTHVVGTKAPNSLGMYDMSGNVWEWCEDIYDKDAYSKHQRSNPVYESYGSNRVFRGGSWKNGAHYCRSTNRLWVTPGSTLNTLGFRLARTK